MRLSAPTAAASGPNPGAAIAGARCGMPYDAQLQLSPGFRVMELWLDPAAGLSADPQRPGRVHGIAQRAGSFELRVRVADAQGRQRELAVQLHVSPDPRSLWKDLPSDPNAAFPKPALADQQLPLDTGAELLAVSIRGRMHANVGGFRDDDVTMGALPGGRFALLVADGAGSAELSREGSRLAVAAALASLRSSLSLDQAVPAELLLGTAAQAALQAIGDQAARSDRAPADFNTTLLIVVCSEAPPHEVWVLQVGDGLVAALTADGRWTAPLGVADHGDYHGQTRFLSPQSVAAADLPARLQCHRFEQLRYLLVATDGVVDPHFETDHALGQASQWQPYVARLEQALHSAEGALPGLYQWLQEFTPGHHDDRTLALARWPL